MPIYEFRCKQCHKLTSLFVRTVTERRAPACSGCGSQDMAQIISGFAYHRSLASIHEDAGEPSMNAGLDYYKDPRNIGRWAEKRFKDMGVEMPDKAREMIAAAREGELPEPVKDL